MQAKAIVSLLQANATHESRAGSFRLLPGLILKKYWTRNEAILMVYFSYWPLVV